MDGKAEVKRHRIVVVNDDAVQLAVLVGLLRKLGHSVFPCTGVEEAFKAMAGGPPPSLIVTDLHMPSIDGWRFCRLLRSPEYPAFNETPILVVSATFSGEESQRITAELGADGFLAMPVDSVKLDEQVRALLSGEARQAAPRVLIVDDSRAVRSMLNEAFATHGYATATAATGGEGREKLRTFMPDSMIIDYHLPDMLGDGLLEEVRQVKPQCAPLMITTDPDPHLAVKWMSMGAAAYVRKPFDPEYVIRLCGRLRRERSVLGVEDRLEERTRELRDSEARYRTLFAEVPDALIVHRLMGGGLSGRIIEVNDVACRQLGYTREELTGMLVGEIAVMEGDEDRRRIVSRLGTGKGVVFDREHVARDGSRIPVEVHARLFQFHGEPAVMALVRDISERKRAEEERRRLEKRLHQDRKLESLRVMAGSIAHRFNNLLTAVRGNIELAEEDMEPGSSATDRIREAAKAADQAAALSRAMLTYVGQIQCETEVVDLGGLVDEVLDTMRPSFAQTVRVVFDQPGTVTAVRGDSALLRQVVASLVENAVEAIGDGHGTVTVRCGRRFCDGDYLQQPLFEGSLAEGEYVFVSVADTGCGMDHETLSKVFDPFFSTKFAGRGLGLSAVRGIVRTHRGGLAVSSEQDSGSCFTVLLPPCPGGG